MTLGNHHQVGTWLRGRSAADPEFVALAHSSSSHTIFAHTTHKTAFKINSGWNEKSGASALLHEESMGVANLQTARQALICIDFHSFLLQLKQFVTQSLVLSLKYVWNPKS